MSIASSGSGVNAAASAGLPYIDRSGAEQAAAAGAIPSTGLLGAGVQAPSRSSLPYLDQSGAVAGSPSLINGQGTSADSVARNAGPAAPTLADLQNEISRFKLTGDPRSAINPLDVFDFDHEQTNRLSGPSAAEQAGYPSGRQALLATLPADIPMQNPAPVGLYEASTTILRELPAATDAAPFSMQQMHDEATRPGASDDLKRAYNRVKNDPTALAILSGGPGRSANDVSAMHASDFQALNRMSLAYPETVFDGKVKASRQGGIGDCFALSAINALSAAPGGAQRLGALVHPVLDNDAQTWNDSHFEVTFPGDSSKTKYSVTKKEIDDARTAELVSNGDLTTNILEIALEKQAHDHGSTITQGGDMVKPLVLLSGGVPAHNKIDPNNMQPSIDALTQAVQSGNQAVTVGTNVRNYDGSVMQNLISGNEQNRRTAREISDGLGALQKAGITSGPQYDALVRRSKELENETRDALAKAEQAAPANHALAVTAVRDGIVTFTNPWNSGEALQMPIGEFFKIATDWQQTSIPQ